MRRRRGRNAIFKFGERLARQNDGLEIRGRRFIRLGLARRSRIRRRSVFGRRQIAPGWPPIASAASPIRPSPATVASATLPAAIAKPAASAIISLRERRMLGALHRSSRRSAAFGGRLLSGSCNLERLAFKWRNSRSSLKSLDRLNGRDFRYCVRGHGRAEEQRRRSSWSADTLRRSWPAPACGTWARPAQRGRTPRDVPGNR